MFSRESLDWPARVDASDRYYITNWLDGVFWIYKGRGLYAVTTERSPLHAWVRKADPQKQTQSGPLAESERTCSRPQPDSEQTTSGRNFLKSGFQADPKQTPGLLSGSALVLGWVRSVLFVTWPVFIYVNMGLIYVINTCNIIMLTWTITISHAKQIMLQTWIHVSHMLLLLEYVVCWHIIHFACKMQNYTTIW